MKIDQLSPSYLADIGQPEGAYLNAEGSLVAVCSHFLSPFWPGRADLNFLYRRRRLSLYRSDWSQRLAVFDQASFPINDVAFHPQRPLCAIATGSYDGGYLFEGELWIWDWETGRSWSVLGESREVTGVRFVQDGSLEVSLRPRDEDEFPQAPFDTRLVGRLQDWNCQAQLDCWNEDPRLENFLPTVQAEPLARRAEELLPPAFETRYAVADVAWRDQQILATQATCALEGWGEETFQCPVEGQGVQLLATSKATFLHVLRQGRSSLLRLEGRKLVPWQQFECGYLFSFDRHGRMLARHTDQDGSPDLLLDPQPSPLKRSGHFDCFNHALRLDGGEHLYFLRGTPPSSHQNKVLCWLDLHNRVQTGCAWDGAEAHLMLNQAGFLGDGSLLRAYKVHSPQIHMKGRLDCLQMPEGKPRWQHDVDSTVTCLAGNFYGLADGSLGCLDPATGKSLWQERIELDGVTAIPLCLQLRGHQLACGTHDGRVLRISLDPLLSSP